MTPSTRRAQWRDARLDDLVVWWCEDLPRVDGRLRFAFYALVLYLDLVVRRPAPAPAPRAPTARARRPT